MSTAAERAAEALFPLVVQSVERAACEDGYNAALAQPKLVALLEAVRAHHERYNPECALCVALL